MDFFKSGLKTVLGAPEAGQQPSAGETVIPSIFHMLLPSDPFIMKFIDH